MFDIDNKEEFDRSVDRLKDFLDGLTDNDVWKAAIIGPVLCELIYNMSCDQKSADECADSYAKTIKVTLRECDWDGKGSSLDRIVQKH